MADTPTTYLSGGFIDPYGLGCAIVAQLERAKIVTTASQRHAITEAFVLDLPRVRSVAEAQFAVSARMARMNVTLTPYQRGAISAAISDNVTHAVGEELRARLANPEAYEPRPMTALESLLLSTDGRTAPDEIRAAMRADADRSAA